MPAVYIVRTYVISVKELRETLAMTTAELTMRDHNEITRVSPRRCGKGSSARQRVSAHSQKYALQEREGENFLEVGIFCQREALNDKQPHFGRIIRRVTLNRVKDTNPPARSFSFGIAFH